MTGLVYGSVCSGIEAASVAWEPLGWTPAFFSEIEAFPRAVLKHRFPEVPLHGDFTTIQAGDYRPIDLLVGGTPCQSFSVAGLRGGLDDDRGNLALQYLRLAERLRPRWLAWENVPGVFSSISHAAPDPCPPPNPMDMELDGQEMEVEDEYESSELHAFNCFLAGVSELGYGFAYRVLDAQYAGVPQRRRRVFVVGYLGDWRPAAAVLFERHSLQGDPAPRREAGKIAPTIPSRGSGGGGLGTDFDCDGGLIQAFGGNNRSGPIDVATALSASHTASGRMDFTVETFIATPILDGAKGRTDKRGSRDGCAMGEPGAPMFTLRAESAHAVAFDLRGRDDGAQMEGPHDTANIRAASGGSSRSYIAFAENQRCEVRELEVAGAQSAIRRGDAKNETLLAFQSSQSGCREVQTHATLDANNGSRRHNGVASRSGVRRLTPLECERLQGFPDGWTDLAEGGGKPTPDGPRYRALGNSMAVPVMAWIGRRIAMVEALRR